MPRKIRCQGLFLLRSSCAADPHRLRRVGLNLTIAMFQRFLQFLPCIAAIAWLTSCASQSLPGVDAAGLAKNPFPEGTYEHFTAEPDYPKTYDVYRDSALLAATNPENSRIVIKLASQRGLLMNGDAVAMDYPICSGIPSRPTPPGTYEVLEMLKAKRSNMYGRILDAEGKVVNSDADAKSDPIPDGGKFVGASMPYWMRMSWDGIGHHVGPVKRRPASHACVRGPGSVMPIVFSKMKKGNTITVE